MQESSGDEAVMAGGGIRGEGFGGGAIGGNSEGRLRGNDFEGRKGAHDPVDGIDVALLDCSGVR